VVVHQKCFESLIYNLIQIGVNYHLVQVLVECIFWKTLYSFKLSLIKVRFCKCNETA